jgi:hypothetical protein
MTANDDLERRIADHYAAEVSHRAPDRVLRAALMTIDTTRQRRGLLPVPWRFPTMQGLTRVAAVAVAVIALGAVGFAVLGPGSRPAIAPSPSASPTIAATPTTAPTASPTITPTPDPSLPPPLGGSFTSAMHGISLAYPTGWNVHAATEPWTQADGLSFGSPNLDTLSDPVLEDHLFLALASEALGGKSGDVWVNALMRSTELGCGIAATQPITVDGAKGKFCPNSNVVVVATGGRGYSITLYLSSDEPWLSSYYDRAWFQSVLDTVKLNPAAAGRSGAPSTPASATPKPS